MRLERGDSELEDGSGLGWLDPKFPSSPFSFSHLRSYHSLGKTAPPQTPEYLPILTHYTVPIP